jgi:hypothetical protein
MVASFYLPGKLAMSVTEGVKGRDRCGDSENSQEEAVVGGGQNEGKYRAG